MTHPKTLTAEEKKKQEDKIDRQMKDSFPASDPPSFSGGNHIIGAPVERQSDSPTAESPEVKKAEEKVKSGEAKVKHSYEDRSTPRPFSRPTFRGRCAPPPCGRQ